MAMLRTMKIDNEHRDQEQVKTEASRYNDMRKFMARVAAD